MSGVNEFTRIERTYRGQTFIFEEADVATYDKCLKKSTKTSVDPATGQDTEEVDENMLLRLLMRECLREPKISDFSGIGLRLMRQLERDVRDLHFGLEPPTEAEKPARTRKAKVEDFQEDDDPKPEES